MQLKISKVYGSAKLELEIEATDIKEGLLKASIFTTKDTCDLCKSAEIGLEGSQTTDGIIYIKRKCSKCQAASTLGTYKNGKGFFWKKFEHWNKETAAPSEEPPLPEDLPF